MELRHSFFTRLASVTLSENQPSSYLYSFESKRKLNKHTEILILGLFDCRLDSELRE